MNISITPFHPNSLKLTAHGYIKITSTSKSTNNMATKKYLIEKGWRALPITLIPDSKVVNLSLVFLLGPKRWVAKSVTTTKPNATIIWNIIGIKSCAVLCACITIMILGKIKIKRQDYKPCLLVLLINSVSYKPNSL